MGSSKGASKISLPERKLSGFLVVFSIVSERHPLKQRLKPYLTEGAFC